MKVPSQKRDNGFRLIEIIAGLMVIALLLGSCARSTPIRFGDIEIPDRSGIAMTVLGPVDPSVLGHTLMHEHLYILNWIPLDQPERWKTGGLEIPTSDEALNFWNAPLTLANRDQLMEDYFLLNKDAQTLDLSDTLPEVQAFKRLGGNTIVDMPPIEEPRRPLKLVDLSRQSDVNIVVATSFYTEAWHPQNIDQLSISDLTRYMVTDIVEGMDGTDVKAGLVGEVPAVNMELGPNSNNETRILRAAARASRLTGAALSLHSSFNDREGIEIMLHRSLDIIEEEGVDFSRVIVGHVRPGPRADLALFEELLARGVYLEFDLLGDPEKEDSQRSIDTIASLIERGHGARLLVSQDIYTKFHLRKFGGEGLIYVHSVLLPALRDKGISEAAIDQIIEENPRQVLTFNPPQNLPISTTQ